MQHSSNLHAAPIIVMKKDTTKPCWIYPNAFDLIPCGKNAILLVTSAGGIRRIRTPDGTCVPVPHSTAALQPSTHWATCTQIHREH